VRTIALAALVALVGCSKNAEPTSRAPTDKDRFQGVWAVESVECGVELSAPVRQRMMDSRLHVHEYRFTLGTGDQWEFSTFVADWSKEPKVVTLYEVGADGQSLGPTKGIPKPARARMWIYKFEGEKLVLGLLWGSNADSVPPPADFKTEPGQNVMVLRLVKTNEEPRTQWDAKPPAGGAKK
jgi:uncharacterized protein (TIGR03067 family)